MLQTPLVVSLSQDLSKKDVFFEVIFRIVAFRF